MTRAPFFNHELACLEAMREAKAQFFDDIVCYAKSFCPCDAIEEDQITEDDIKKLRTDAALQVAEFYYLLKEFGITSTDKLSCFIDSHNQDMINLLQDKAKLRFMGLLEHRIRSSIFSPQQKVSVLANSSYGGVRLEQADVGRFLATLISPETCRIILVALGKGGLVGRRKGKQVILTSNGVLEGFYEKHLHHIVCAVRKLASIEITGEQP